MDAPRVAVRLSALAAVLALSALVVLSVVQEGTATAATVLDKEGQPLVVPREVGTYAGVWVGKPVLVVVTRQAILDGVERVHGEGSATPAESLGDGLRMFVLSAKSTHLGCTVGFNTGLGASRNIADYDGDGAPDGRMLDPCHHGQWDVYHRGEAQPGSPTHGRRMAVLHVDLQPDGTLLGRGFDGPIGPPG